MPAIKLPEYEIGSENIFADLGLPDADEHQLKAALVVQSKRLIAERGLTQARAASLIQIKQPTFPTAARPVSVERRMRMLTVFDHDIEINL